MASNGYLGHTDSLRDLCWQVQVVQLNDVVLEQQYDLQLSFWRENQVKWPVWLDKIRAVHRGNKTKRRRDQTSRTTGKEEYRQSACHKQVHPKPQKCARKGPLVEEVWTDSWQEIMVSLSPAPSWKHVEGETSSTSPYTELPGSCITTAQSLQQAFHSLDFRRSSDVSDPLNLLLQAQLHTPFRLLFRVLSRNVR